jgi:hypothetical protein
VYRGRSPDLRSVPLLPAGCEPQPVATSYDLPRAGFSPGSDVRARRPSLHVISFALRALPIAARFL